MSDLRFDDEAPLDVRPEPLTRGILHREVPLVFSFGQKNCLLVLDGWDGYNAID